MLSPGERIRAAREKLGLTQAELAGEHLSASYVSHLEHDRRRATPEALQHLASRLGVSVEELRAAPSQISAAHYAASVAAHVRALETALDGDLGSRTEGLVAADPASPADDDWVTMYLAAEGLRHHGQYERLSESAEALLRHPLTQESASLRTAALALHATALRAIGQLTRSLEVARQAVAAAEESQDSSSIARAALALIATLSELGVIEELPAQVDRLTSLLESIPSPQLRGRIAWAAGNAQFILGDAAAGLDLHDRASQWLRPDADLRLWARFCKASANRRITAGITAGVEKLLHDAELGLELVGNDDDRSELLIARANFLLLASDSLGAIALAERALQTATLPAQTQATGYEVMARAAEQRGSGAEARQHWAKAAELFSEAGAVDSAISIWRRLAQQA
ncbi:helix-turn-helix transcriptional regulator [Microbacterium sp. LWH11-1.2]|uniref:helix-turn-helix domain-containing protein n=1 Tax=unclassified Microbacterium TaxID=2609290 RepID=UPI00313A0059